MGTFQLCYEKSGARRINEETRLWRPRGFVLTAAAQVLSQTCGHLLHVIAPLPLIPFPVISQATLSKKP